MNPSHFSETHLSNLSRQLGRQLCWENLRNFDIEHHQRGGESKNAVAESCDACGTQASRLHFRIRFNEVQDTLDLSLKITLSFCLGKSFDGISQHYARHPTVMLF